MNYVEHLNSLIKERVAVTDNLVIFGQNIAAGSCLSGLTRELKVRPESRVINTANSENTLCAIGFGVMLSAANAIFFMKQLDFLFLGMDHLVNTFNLIRRKESNGSFTIFPVVVDSGYEGPQSSTNNLSDFCSIARVQGLTLTNKVDSQEIIRKNLVKPGFRIICCSQRLFKTEIIDREVLYMNDERTIYQYATGKDVTIVCLNFSLPNGIELNTCIEEAGLTADLFSVNEALPVNWRAVLASIETNNRLIIMDDSKSPCSQGSILLNEVYERCSLRYKKILRRDFSGYSFRPNSDQMHVDFYEIIEGLRSSIKI